MGRLDHDPIKLNRIMISSPCLEHHALNETGDCSSAAASRAKAGIRAGAAISATKNMTGITRLIVDLVMLPFG
jgi:hypothetical protein